MTTKLEAVDQAPFLVGTRFPELPRGGLKERVDGHNLKQGGRLARPPETGAARPWAFVMVELKVPPTRRVQSRSSPDGRSSSAPLRRETWLGHGRSRYDRPAPPTLMYPHEFGQGAVAFRRQGNGRPSMMKDRNPGEPGLLTEPIPVSLLPGPSAKDTPARRTPVSEPSTRREGFVSRACRDSGATRSKGVSQCPSRIGTPASRQVQVQAVCFS